MQAKPLRTEVAPYVFEHEPRNLCELERYCWITIDCHHPGIISKLPYVTHTLVLRFERT